MDVAVGSITEGRFRLRCCICCIAGIGCSGAAAAAANIAKSATVMASAAASSAVASPGAAAADVVAALWRHGVVLLLLSLPPLLQLLLGLSGCCSYSTPPLPPLAAMARGRERSRTTANVSCDGPIANCTTGRARARIATIWCRRQTPMEVEGVSSSPLYHEEEPRGATHTARTMSTGWGRSSASAPSEHNGRGEPAPMRGW